jgi:uncharacterized protein (TIGR00369 family)
MQLSILDYLRKHIDGTLTSDDTNRMQYPPPIARTLGFNLVDVASGEATIEMRTEPARHANPMGTIHGGVLCDLADAAIGTAHATTLSEGESFTSIDLKMNFFRPIWDATRRAQAKAVHLGKTTSYYECRITREDDKLIAMATSTVMTLRGGQSAGR